MSLRIVLVIDEGEGAELIGLLAKALGRGELGIMDFRLEAVDAPPKRLPAPAKARKPYTPRWRSHTGGERWAKLKPAFETGPLKFFELSMALEAAGFARTGTGNAVKEWMKFGYIKKVGPGRYAITEEGRNSPGDQA